MQIDDGEPQAIGLNAGLTVPGLPPGIHSVLLGNVASHCDVNFGANPISVRIGAAYMVNADFIVVAVTTHKSSHLIDTGGPRISCQTMASRSCWAERVGADLWTAVWSAGAG